MQPYINPGRSFIERHQLPDLGSELQGYVERFATYLREESGVGHTPPIDLDGICSHFGVTLANAPLGSASGGGSFGPDGLIVINEEDPETRRRFTKGHEIMELLFAALKEARVSDEVWQHLSGQTKERLCDRGAAVLLIPLSPLIALYEADGLSIPAIQSTAQSFGASPLATLIRAVEDGPGCHALVGWHRALKPKEQRQTSGGAQLSLSSDLRVSPTPELRVKWVTRSRNQTTPFVPKHKSVPPTSLISECCNSDAKASGYEDLNLGKFHVRCFIEAFSDHPASDTDVITLLHFPNDGDCLAKKEL